MKLLRVLSIIGLYLSITNTAISGQATGQVTDYNITNNVFIFSISGAATGHPTCATDTRWVINPKSIQANAYKDAIISAKANGLIVEVGGLNVCDAANGIESVGYIVAKSKGTGITINSVATDASSTQIIISGTGLKDSGNTKVSLAGTPLTILQQSTTTLVAQCPGNPSVCVAGDRALQISTFTNDSTPLLVSKQLWNFTIGAVGPQGPQGPQGPAVHTSAACTNGGSPTCTCKKLISKQYAGSTQAGVAGSCTVTSDTGKCSGLSFSAGGGSPVYEGSCCICSP